RRPWRPAELPWAQSGQGRVQVPARAAVRRRSASPQWCRRGTPRGLRARGWTHSHSLGDSACEEESFYLDTLVNRFLRDGCDRQEIARGAQQELSRGEAGWTSFTVKPE